MSQENVEIVRRFLHATRRFFDAYLEDPRSIAAALEADDLWPEYREAITYVHPEVVWKTVFLGQTERGYLGVAKVWDDYLKWAEDYRLGVPEVEDLGGQRVYATLAVVGKAKASGAPMEARFLDVFSLREGLIARLEEYTTRAEAFEAAALLE